MVRVELLHYTSDGEKLVALFTKMYVTGDTSISDEEIEKWIVESIKKQYWEPWRLSLYVFKVEGCSRTCVLQLMSLGIGSVLHIYQSSLSNLKDLLIEVGKYVGMSCRDDDYMCFALALDKLEEKLEKEGNRVKLHEMFDIAEKSFKIPLSVKIDEELYKEYTMFVLDIAKFYLIMISRGVHLEDADSILPQALYTKIVIAMNAKELATSFLPTGLCARAHQEVQEVAWKMWHKLKIVHPRLFKYIGPHCLLMENILRNTPVPLDDILNEKAVIEMLPRCPEQVQKKDVAKCINNAYNNTFNIRF